MRGTNDVKTIEMDLLLEGIFRKEGYNFRNCDSQTLLEKIGRRLRAEHVETVSGLQEKIFHEPRCMERLLSDLSTNGHAERIPDFLRVFNRKIIPQLRTYPFIRIWQPGSFTGIEPLFMAIALVEQGLYDRSKIYVTDILKSALKRAKDGIFPLSSLRDLKRQYVQSEGRKVFADYYKIKNKTVILNPALKKNILYAQHNLMTDRSFNEFNLILCGNPLRYLDPKLQERILGLFHESLCRFGFLLLEENDSLEFSSFSDQYQLQECSVNLYRRIR